MKRNAKRLTPFQIRNALKIREMKKIKIKLKGYIDSFYSICFFDEKTLDWNEDSEKQYKVIRGKWKAYCKKNDYIDEGIITAFQYDCMLLKTDLIAQEKYNIQIENSQDIIILLKKGMSPLEIADYSIKNLETSKI